MSSPEEIAKLCWQRGAQAVNNEDFDYATEMFYRSVTLVPDNLAYRQSLRTAEFKKYDNNLKGAGMMSRPKLVRIRSKLSRAKSKGDWDEVDKLAEEGLLLNPWDAGLNAAVGQACHQRGYNTVAIFAYQVAVGPGGEPDNVNLQREFAKLLQADEKFKEAAVVWSKVHKLAPNDGEARSNITACQFEEARQAGKYDEAGSTRDVMPTHEINKRLGKDPKNKQVDAPGMDPEKDLLHAIRKDPNRVELHQKLGEFYRDKDELEKAKEAYQKAWELSDNDQNIKEVIEDIELSQLAKQVDDARTAAKASPDDESLRKQAARLARQLLDREIEVYSERIERYPQNKRLKFDLARRFQKLKRWGEAIPLFQQASLDPRLEVESLVALGKCFLQDNKPPLAEKQFVKALPKVSSEDNPETFKDLHYYLARIYEQSKRYKEAEDHYGEILAIDYDYKDVLQRMENMAE